MNNEILGRYRDAILLVEAARIRFALAMREHDAKKDFADRLQWSQGKSDASLAAEELLLVAHRKGIELAAAKRDLRKQREIGFILDLDTLRTLLVSVSAEVQICEYSLHVRVNDTTALLIEDYVRRGSVTTFSKSGQIWYSIPTQGKS